MFAKITKKCLKFLQLANVYFNNNKISVVGHRQKM